MRIKSIILLLAVAVMPMTLCADEAREKVEKGIAQVERLVDAHKWHEAFEQLRNVEQGVRNSSSLLYLTTKERYNLYSRLKKQSEMTLQMQRMEQLALNSKDAKTIEDMLHQKAAYHARRGESRDSRECYVRMFELRASGKDDAGREATMRQMIEEASTLKNQAMKLVATDLHTAWQDSVAAVKAAAELAQLKDDYQMARMDIEQKEAKIGRQWGMIVTLAVLLLIVSVGIVILALVMMNAVRGSRSLKKSLQMSEENSRQKSLFMRNISNQIVPSLNEIGKGNMLHVKALEGMMQDVETFVQLDDTKSESYQTEQTDVKKLCEEVVAECSMVKVPVVSDATSLFFPVATDEIKLLLKKIVVEVASDKQTERVTIGFKKRNPHTGQFTVTAIGLKLDEELKSQLFTAFARVCDLTETTGLVLPICSLMAHKMGGEMMLDNQFAKGTRFVVELKN